MIWLQGLNFLVKPLWIFGVDRVAQIQLGDELYGQYYVIFTFCLMFNILLDLGLNNYLTTQIASERPINIKKILSWRIILALVYVILIAIFTQGQPWTRELIILAVANQLIASFVLFYRAILQGNRQFKQDAIVSVTDRGISIIGGLIWISIYGFYGISGVLAFFGLQTMGYLIALLLAIYWSKRIPNQESNDDFKTIWKSIQWFAILAFLMSIFTRVDTFMLSKLAPDTFVAAGVYAKSFRLLDACLIFSALLSTLLLPNYSKRIKDGTGTSQLTIMGTKIILTVGLPLLLLAYFYAPEVMTLIYKTGNNSESNKTFIFIMASFLPMALIHIFGTYLTAASRLKTLSAYAIVSMICSLVLNYILIPKQGALGSAEACLVTQSLFAILCIFGSYKAGAFYAYEFPILRLSLFILAALGFFSSSLTLGHGIWFGLFSAALTALVGFLLLFPSWRTIGDLLKK
jgi:O-antigen/teichoic acid export membrane protein